MAQAHPLLPKSTHGANAIVLACMPLPKPTQTLWEWFTEALAATLTTMPTNSRLTLTSGAWRLSARHAIFTMRADHLLAEIYDPLDVLLRLIPAKRNGVHGGLVDMTSWGGWHPPKRWRGRQRWYKITPLPASLPEFQAVAEAVARAFRFVSLANVPHELIAAIRCSVFRRRTQRGGALELANHARVVCEPATPVHRVPTCANRLMLGRQGDGYRKVSSRRL